MMGLYTGRHIPTGLTGEWRVDQGAKEHEDFLRQYVLNRAAAHIGGLSASCVDQAEEAWKRIQRIVNQEHGPTPARDTE